MPIIREPIDGADPSLVEISLPVERRTIEKVRWRGLAEDGTDFAFELVLPLRHGDAVFATGEHVYRLRQRPETLLHIPWPTSALMDAARLAWNLGNLHQPIEVRENGIYVADDSAMRAKLVKLGCEYQVLEGIFRPQLASAAHSH